MMYRSLLLFAGILVAVSACSPGPDRPMSSDNWSWDQSDLQRNAGQTGPDTLSTTYNGEASLPASLWH